MIISRALLPVSPPTKTTLSKSYAPHNISVPTKFGTAHNADSGWTQPQLKHLEELNKSLTRLSERYERPLIKALSHNPKDENDLGVVNAFIAAWKDYNSKYENKFPNNDTLTEIYHQVTSPLRGMFSFCEYLLDEPRNRDSQEFSDLVTEKARVDFNLTKDCLRTIHNLFHAKYIPLSETWKFVESNNMANRLLK